MAMHRRSREALVAAPSELCFATLVDYERAPDWQGPVKAVEVLERGEDGLGRVVAYEIDAKVRTVRYTLRHAYGEAPLSVISELVEGDVKHLEGEWRFVEREPAMTHVTFSAVLDPGLFVPGPVRRIIEGQVMGAALEDLRREAERIASS